MQIIRQLNPIDILQNQRTILSIGSYDGIHQGHKYIIKELNKAASAQGASSAVITLYPRPKAVLVPGVAPDFLTTVNEKIFLFEKLGLDIIAILPFTREFAMIPAREFMEQVVAVFKPLELWVGTDFRFGTDRQGDVSYLEEIGPELGFSVKSVDLQAVGPDKVSSTRIRSLLKIGQIREATELLGHYPFILGQVGQGAKRGRTIGFPTANIIVDKDKLLPSNGVYTVWITVAGKTYPAVANIGIRPTFGETEKVIEVHIFDFDQDIYGQKVRVDLVEHLRAEQSFDSIDALIAQISQDAEHAKTMLETEAQTVSHKLQVSFV